jgi:hypothetical protein
MASKIINELIKRLQEVFLSSSSCFEERQRCLQMLTSMSSTSAEEVCSQVSKFTHILHLEINGRQDTESIKSAANALGAILSNSGILASDLLMTETASSLEQLKGFKILNHFDLILK